LATVRVVKRKWDGTVSAMDTASRLAVPGEAAVWFALAGTRRERPASGAIEVVKRDELWVAVPGEWWVLCGYGDETRSLTGYMVHAAAQFHDHAHTMGYPDDVVRGAWSGISMIAARFTNGEWPFDGAMQGWLQAA